MTSCTSTVKIEFTTEGISPTFLSTINRLTEWAVVHPYGSFAFTCFLDEYFQVPVVREDDKDPFYYYMIELAFLGLLSFLGCVAWEFYELFMYLIGFEWFYESVYKKLFDIFQDSIGIIGYLLFKYVIGLVRWRKTGLLEKVPSIILKLLEFGAATLSCIFYVRNTCYPFNVVGLEYFFNTVPIGYYLFIVVMVVLIYLDIKRSIYVFPEHKNHIKKMMTLNYIYFFGLS